VREGYFALFIPSK